MKLGLDARIMAMPKAGISTYLANLTEEFSKIPGLELVLFGDKPFSADFEHYAKTLKCLFFARDNRKRWAQFYLPKKLKQEKIDIYHATWNNAVPIFSPCPVVVSIHDLIPLVLPGYFKSAKKRIKFQLQELSAAHVSKKILTLSGHSKKDIVRLFRVNSDKVVPVPIGVEDDFKIAPRPEEIREAKEKFNLPDKYFLTVGGFDQPRRNIKFLISAFIKYREDHKSDTGLVVVKHSQPNKHLLTESRTIIEKSLFRDKIKLVDQFEKQDLIRALYGASALILPSLYEGFGLPALEAMTAGIPVLASNTSSVPEVVGDCGIYFDPRDEMSLTGAIDEISVDEHLRKILIERGRARSAGFSWKEAARKTLEVYYDVQRKNHCSCHCQK